MTVGQVPLTWTEVEEQETRSPGQRFITPVLEKTVGQVPHTWTEEEELFSLGETDIRKKPRVWSLALATVQVLLAGNTLLY